MGDRLLVILCALHGSKDPLEKIILDAEAAILAKSNCPKLRGMASPSTRKFVP